MKIPTRLQEKLSQYPELYAGVLASIAQAEPWISSNKLPFFPEYTDHGIGHLEAVLATAESLIRDEAWHSLTPADAAALCLAVLLHDLAMHLTEDGFVELVSPNGSWHPLDGFGDKQWSLLWSDFISEARRWDGRRLTGLFGDSRPVRVPPHDPNEMTRTDRQLIGEFLRRHHHRLAHEIAIYGVPGPTNDRIRLREIPEGLADLAGLIGRSHGLPLRNSLVPLEQRFALREFRGVRAPFLMVVLRVSDYLQVQAERAPTQILQVARIRSPVSLREWEAHQSILDIQNTHADPEAIYLVARPATVQAFLKVREWQAGIQAELDVGWAVLGEVYGRFHGLSNLGLIIRRVRSSLDDIDEFRAQVTYIPRHAAFEAAGADLLKLLIAPLYGDRPSIGVRELMQNAVDAVLERRLWQETDPRFHVSDGPDVLISISRDQDGRGWLEVHDQGIGMTPEIVVDFFLRAGASYRRSQEWHERFEDEEGHARVRRSGRFGVGALAAFLLGSEVTVVTRHVDEPEGLKFRATVESDTIQIDRVQCSVGTTIRVRLSKKARKMLVDEIPRGWESSNSWDWFCLSDPKVERRLGKRVLEQRFSLPNAGDTLEYPWRRIAHSDFEDVLWTYSHAPTLVCNGITVQREAGHFAGTLWNSKDSIYMLKAPSVSVFDRDGALPLNLQRDQTNEDFPFKQELQIAVAKDVIAWLSVHGPREPLGIPVTSMHYLGEFHPAITYSDHWRSRAGLLFCTEEGFGFSDPWNLSHLGDRTILYLPASRAEVDRALVIRRGYAAFFQHTYNGEMGIRTWVRFLTTGPGASKYTDMHSPLASLAVKGRRILLREQEADILLQPRKLPLSVRLAIEEEWRRSGWVLWRMGECDCENVDFATFASTPPGDAPLWNSLEVFAEWYPEAPKPVSPASPLSMVWSSVLGSAVMPYDAKTRQAILSSDKTIGDYLRDFEIHRDQNKPRR
jgi:signal transduction histidine kinase